jgi:UDP-N-acetylglucosamine 2-epimerase (non-hydrolysing)
MHRAENVDIETRLRSLLESLDALGREYGLPIICSTHPRTRAVMERFSVNSQLLNQIQFHEPFGLFDFIALERNAFCVLSDSGTVQEECCLFKVANVTIRDVTERPEND